MVRQKKNRKALDLLAAAARADPADAGYSYAYAIALNDSGQRTEAIKTLKQALEIHPYHRNMLMVLADLCHQAVCYRSHFDKFRERIMKQHCAKLCQPHRTLFESCLGFLILFATILSARSAFAQDLMVYPAKGQSQTQQDKDRYECHTWAVKQTGFDPSKPPPATAAIPAGPQQPSQPHVLKGATRGAALGAVGGAITGNAGKGAAAGAAMGGLSGGFRRRDERIQQSYQQQGAVQSAQSAQQNQRIAYNRAMAACLEGRGYTVK